MENWLQRTELLIGSNKLNNLNNKTVAIFGLGGVGSYTAEAIVRSGIGHIILVDSDTISLTNLNRQLLATQNSIGKPKVEVAKERYLNINPDLHVDIYQEYISSENIDTIFSQEWDYVVDAIDSIPSKMTLIENCYQKNVPILSCMGTGNKLDASRFQITTIEKTSVCPLAKIMRKNLKEKNIHHVKVLYSDETPFSYTKSSCPASISFVPSVAGLLIAGEVIRDLMNK